MIKDQNAIKASLDVRKGIQGVGIGKWTLENHCWLMIVEGQHGN